MPDSVTIREDKYIHVYSEGEFTLNESKKTIDRIIAIFEDMGINKVLVDTREQKKGPINNGMVTTMTGRTPIFGMNA